MQVDTKERRKETVIKCVSINLQSAQIEIVSRKYV